MYTILVIYSFLCCKNLQGVPLLCSFGGIIDAYMLIAHMYSCKQKEFLNFCRTWTLLSVCALFKAFLVQRASFIWWSVNVHQCFTATTGIWIYHHFKGKVAVRFERKILALPKVGDLTYNIIALCFCVVWVLEIYKIILDWCFFAVMESF